MAASTARASTKFSNATFTVREKITGSHERKTMAHAISTRILLAGLGLAAAAAASAASAASAAPAQQPAIDRHQPQIDEIVGQISAQRIEGYIRKLVSFKTRHTMSDTVSETEGIGAARRWIKGELERCGAAQGGRLQVAFDSHITPVSARISRPTEIVNVVATLPGAQAASKDRMYVVSGHYDSRNTDIMDAKGDAPGGGDGNGMRDGALQVRRDAGVHDGGGRGAGPAGRRALGRGSEEGQPEYRRHVHQRHHRQLAR
jgi:hypothetical protein